MDVILKSFNGFLLNTSDYRGAVITSKGLPEAVPVFISQAEADSQDTDAFTLGTLTVPVRIRVINMENRLTLESQLKEALKPGTKGDLVVTFTDESVDYKKSCRVVSITPDNKFVGSFTIVLQTGESAWSVADEETQTWNVTASGDTKTITVGGYSKTKLSLDIEPTAAPAGGWAYQRLYKLIPPDGITLGIRPWKIDLDTAALVTAGKMQADCDDLIVLVDGQQIRRWIVDANTDHTGVWINVNMPTGASVPISKAINSTETVTKLSIIGNSTNYSKLAKIPVRGFIVHGTEWFEYTSVNASQCYLTISARGALGTTKQAHVINDVFQIVPYAIHVLYGNSIATDPASGDSTYDNDKPVFDLSASTNTSWVYTASTLFYDPLFPGRPGSWIPLITNRYGDVTKTYNFSGNVDGADPAMGLLIAPYLKLGRWMGEYGNIAWQINQPGGIASITMTGRKYRANTLWPGAYSMKCGLGYYSNAISLAFWTESQPTSVATWEAVSHTSSTAITKYTWAIFSFIGSMLASSDAAAYFEALTLTLGLVSTGQPTGSMGSEAAALLLELTVTNTTNGDEIALAYPLLLNTHMVVDGEERTVTLDGVNAQAAMMPADISRDVWIRLEPGTNVIEVSGSNVGPTTVDLKWLARRM